MFVTGVTAAPRAVPVARMPAGTGMVRFDNVPDGQCRDGLPELVVRRKYPVIPMPMLPRRRDEVRQTIEELKRRDVHDASGSRSRGLAAAAGPDPVGRLMSRQHVADAGDQTIWAAGDGQSFECERRPGAVPQQVFQTPKIAGHIAVDERDPDARVD